MTHDVSVGREACPTAFRGTGGTASALYYSTYYLTAGADTD